MARFLYVQNTYGRQDIRDICVARLKRFCPEDEFVLAGHYKEAVAALTEKGPFDFIISDSSYPGPEEYIATEWRTTGHVDFIKYLLEKNIQTPFVIFSAEFPDTIERELSENALHVPANRRFDQSVTALPDLLRILKDQFLPKARPAGTSVGSDKKLEAS